MDLDSYSDKLTKPRSLWRASLLEDLLKRFTAGERLALYILTAILALSALSILIGLNNLASVVVPAPGGSLTEGEVGPVRFINPLLAISQPDFDLTELVYSGLMRATAHGTYVPDLAQSYEISADGTTYTFHLRRNATFQDGTSVTSDDIVFTIGLAQNPQIKSPQAADWSGVTVSAPDKYTVVFKLSHAYAPFLDNTTMGILPKHLWQNVSAEEFPFSPLNTHPVGSGPYKFASVSTDATGSPTRYVLSPFSKFTLGVPYVSTIAFNFYQNEDAMVSAFNAHRIDAIAGLSPAQLSSLKRNDASLAASPLPRTFGVFFNQNHAQVLSDPSVRQALDAAADKQTILNSVLQGYGVSLSGPIPPGAIEHTPPAIPQPLGSIMSSTTSTTTTDQHFADNAKSILQKGGWKYDDASGQWKKGKQTLSFSLATADEPELVATAHALQKQWKAAGINVSVQVYSLSDLNTSVIRPRAYDAILFGEVVGRSADLFAFWHSSQRNDPGLNLAMYTNNKADALLSQARATSDSSARAKLYSQFETTVAKDAPAVFLYAPEFLYVVPRSLQGVAIDALTMPADRFLNVYQWYTDTQRVWSIFTNQ